VTDPGAKENAPLLAGNGALVADRQRGDDASVGPIPERGEDARADLLAQPLDVVARSAGERVQAAIAIVVANVDRRAKLVLEQPRFDVEAVRVDRAVRPLEPYGEAPALAGVQLRHVHSRLFGAP